MSNLSEQERKAYEQYIFSSSEEDKQSAIKSLIPGSEKYYHLYFLDLFNKDGGTLSEADQKIYDQFLKKYPYSEQLQMI
jgi:hypothetical protein